MAAPVRTESHFELPFPRSDVWPILSKTDWINRAIGLPPVTYEISPAARGGSSVIARARLMGIELRWQELPFEWVEGEFYHVRRIFESGPLIEAVMGMDFWDSNGGAHVKVHSELTPRNAFGSAMAKLFIAPKGSRDMAEVVRHAGEFLKGQQPVVLPRLPKAPVDEQALKVGLEKLAAMRASSVLVQRLEALLRDSADVELAHIRPLAIARAWQFNSWDVLRLFLQATRCGLLDFRWEILCPNCRSSREAGATSLSGLNRTAHCDVCQIKFDAEFDRSVELKFSVNPAIRPADMQTFCLAGPGGKPHIVTQLLLAPGKRRLCKLNDFTRPYRLRSPQVTEPVTLKPDDGPESAFHAVIMCKPDGFDVRFELGQTNECAVQVFNPNEFPVQLILERIGWDSDTLTAARVTNWQEFRDLFSTEVISPHEQITVGSQIILFTDLRGSTAMYNGIGDAPAYALVRNHFNVLVQAVREHHGAVVKTIGDAVMAVFARLDEALAAVEQMHVQLPTANPNPAVGTRLELKSSLHLGPCLAVNANDKLDFFGTTVNLAARMVACCQGGDLTVSDDLYQRPEMQTFVLNNRRVPEASEVKFRGFDSPHKVWRLKMV